MAVHSARNLTFTPRNAAAMAASASTAVYAAVVVAALLAVVSCAMPKPLVITAPPAVEASRTDAGNAPRAAIRWYDSFWKALEDMNTQAAWILVDTREQRRTHHLWRHPHRPGRLDPPSGVRRFGEQPNTIWKPSFRATDDMHPRNLTWYGVPIVTLVSESGAALHLALDTREEETFGTPGMARKTSAHWRAAARRTVRGFGGEPRPIPES